LCWAGQYPRQGARGKQNRENVWEERKVVGEEKKRRVKVRRKGSVSNEMERRSGARYSQGDK
jgi:hypothetical protein